MRLALITSRLAAPLALLLLAACSGSPHPGARHPHAAPSRPSHLAHPLPPGFSAPGSDSTPPAPLVLRVTQVTSLNPETLHPGPFPGNQIRQVTQAIVDQPVPTTVRPLLVSVSSLHPGETLTVAAGDLPVSPHDVLFILQGPSFRSQRLVHVIHGVAVGAVTLPSSLAHGQWALAAEDLSGVQVSGKARPQGTALLDLSIFKI
jgi:hypothetical protein